MKTIHTVTFESEFKERIGDRLKKRGDESELKILLFIFFKSDQPTG